VTGIFKSRPTAESISQPSRTPIPRNERTEVRFALSYDALKIKLVSSAAQISAIFFAMRQTNFSDSITHGPRINAGRCPPIVTLPMSNGFVFTVIIAGQALRLPKFFNYTPPVAPGKRSACPTTLLPALLISRLVAQGREPQMAHRAPERKPTRPRAFPKGKGDANRRENSKWKRLPVYAAEIRS
jgi:hypothetical protein